MKRDEKEGERGIRGEKGKGERRRGKKYMLFE
jgi:hypothetical protein